MTYPKFESKHLEEALFSPEDFIKYRKVKRKNLPKKYILTYGKKGLDYFIRKYKPKKIEVYSLLTIYLYKDIALVRMTGIGAPNAVTLLEELIALGGKTFLNIGTAGGLHKEGTYLCTKALRDEGTSYHYIPHGEFAHPDEELTDKFRKFLKKIGLDFFEGASWTIDSPYRETRAEVERYSKKGISTVEMESSALFSVAKYRKVKMAASFVVSDLLGKKWLPKFHRFDVEKASNNLLDASIKFLLGER